MKKEADQGRANYYGPVAIVGPTATGKTAAAYELARRIGAEVISADSMAVYRGMNIGTAKPSIEQRQHVPFHLIDLVEPDEKFTVADFQERAVQTIDNIVSRGRIPILAGGTGLYIRAVIDGLNIPKPEPNDQIREELNKAAVENGKGYLHRQLAQVDPARAAMLHPNDTKRIIRALEVFEQTGTPMSAFIEETKSDKTRYPNALLFGLTMDRARLYSRIEERVDEQIQAGLVEEVAGLLERGLNGSMPALQGLGYKEIADHLNGKNNLATAISLLKRNTRRFAKRQYTWFRADQRIEWVDVDDLPASEVADIIEAKLRGAGNL